MRERMAAAVQRVPQPSYKPYDGRHTMCMAAVAQVTKHCNAYNETI